MANKGRPIPVTFLCEKCRYDLTNMTKNICPACGAEFDRRELLKRLGREPNVGPKIGVILAVAPIAVILLTAALHMASVVLSDHARLLGMLVIYVIAAAAPIASTRLVFEEVSEVHKDWSRDAQSRVVLAAAIFLVLMVVEVTFMVAAYFLCFAVFGP